MLSTMQTRAQGPPVPALLPGQHPRPRACLQESATCRPGVRTTDKHLSDVLSTALVLFLVETNVFSGSSEKQREAREALSAPPVERKLVKDSLSGGRSAPGSRCPSSNLSEPAASQLQGGREPGVLSPGPPGPSQASGLPLQEDSGAQIDRELPGGKE